MLHPNQIRCYCQSLLLAFCLFVSFGRAGAQSCQLFTIADGLPSSMINDVIEDSDRLIWIATEYGLCKYDGSKFTTYQFEPGNPHSLQQNYVRTLFVDKDNHLLVGTRSGLQVYRPITDDFSEVAVFEGTGRESGDVTKIIQRQNGEIWMAGNTPCCARIGDDGNPVLYANRFTDTVNFTESLVEDNAGRIWVNHRLKSVRRLEVSGDITNIVQDGKDVPFNVLAIGADGQIYAGGQQPGLYRYNLRTDSFDLISDADHNAIMVCDIRNLDEHQLLVATDNQGLLLYDYRTGTLEPSMFDDGLLDPQTQKVHSVWIDHNRDMWLGLYQKGLLMVQQRPQPFRYFGQNSSRYNIVGDKCVSSIASSAQDWVWVSTDNGGLFAVNAQGQQKRYFPYTGGKPGTIPTSLCRVFEDSRQRLWYGAYSQGYGWIDPNTGRCTPLSVIGNKEPSLSVFDFAEDHLGRIWVATMGLGVYCFDEPTRSLNYHVPSDSCRWNHCLYFEPMRRKLYVGSYNGLSEIDVIDPKTPMRQFLSQYIIYSIVPYTSGRLALCTSEGLVIFDMNTCQSVAYTMADGLSSNMVYAGGCDGNGLLWLTTNVGLSCFNEKQGGFTNFDIHDGLQSNEFYKNVSLVESDGDIWFGGTNGITFFNPREVTFGAPECDVRVVGMLAGENKVTDPNRMSFDDNSFTFELAALPVGHTHHMTYSYSMDGDPWTKLPAGQNLVSFSRVSPGKHIFRYRSQIGQVLSDEHSLKFQVNFPWYQSWWTQLLIFALLVVIFLMAYTQLTHRSKVRKRLAQHLQNEAVNEEKIKFFMNVADEVRTPMTMIMSPLQTLIDTDPDSSRQLQYRMIQRNSNRIVELINQLMDQHHIDSKLFLPKQEESQPDEPKETPAEPVSPSHSHKLIIVADADKEICHFMAQELSAEYRVLECTSGREAFDQTMRLVPDLIISDVKIPDVSGMELCRRVRQNVRINHIPVVMLSATASEETRIESLDLGADAFITKPFSMKVLRRTVRNLLQSRDRLRNSFSGQQMPTDQVETPESKSPDERLMERIMKVVNQNLSNPELTSEMIASEVGMSRVHLYRKLKELTNQSARNFIRNIRLAKAAELLSQKKVSVSEVADKVGFTNSSNFATAFKELYGMSPTAYMEEHIHRDGD